MRRSNEPRIYGPYKHGDVWRNHYVTRDARGKRKTEYSTHATRAAAEAELAGARDEAQGITVRMAVDAYLEKVRKRGREDSTIENYEHRLWRLLGLPGNANRPIRWVQNRGAELYEASIGDGANDTHINGLNVGRMFGAFCVKERMLKSNPFADVEAVGRKVKGSSKPRLTVNESRVLEEYCFKHADNPDCVLTYGYLMLGKRASELARVTPKDLDDDGWLLKIREAKSEAGIGDAPIPVLLRDLLVALAAGRAPESHLFVNQAGERMSRYVARERVRAITKAAIGREVNPQELRRTWFDNGLRQGRALDSMASMGGHTSIEVTKRSYASREAIAAGAVERNFQIIAGGKR